jgi:hypothetical protein
MSLLPFREKGQDMTDTASTAATERLLGALGSLAQSVTAQIVATGLVTLAVACMPWLTQGGERAPEASAAAARGAPAERSAAASADSFALAGIAPLAAFPMELEPRFATSLSRPFVALAAADWPDDAAKAQPSFAATRRSEATAATCDTCSAGGGPARLVATVLPPPRPADLADAVRHSTAAATPVQAAATPQRAPFGLAWARLPDLPRIPSVGDMAAQVENAGAVLTRTANTAADTVTGVFKAF